LKGSIRGRKGQRKGYREGQLWVDFGHSFRRQHVTAVNRLFEDPMIQQFWNPATDAGRAALDAMITRQAQIIAYVDDFKLLMIATLAVIPLLIVFKR
jgi:DHA2 family multidrug resistance protein